ncbi:MAG TPA: creatininase family protein [Euryarchaeota archaeon]|nr:MAG: creatininase [Aciduliprofundum sp.]HEU12992.1 creatininase family protein [Euryarchaeota archaeon]
MYLNIMEWNFMTFREIEESIKNDPLVIIPVGSVEEHGNHLPVGSDSFQAIYVAEKISERLNALVLPPIYYGYTELDDFKGTISIGFDALYMIMKDILNSLIRQGVKKILIISGHASGIHMAALKRASNEVVRDNMVKIMLLSDYDIAYELRGNLIPQDDSHAGIIETSRMMAIMPEKVKGDMRFRKGEKGNFLVVSNYSTVYPEGTFSDPRGSSRELGEKINNYVIEKLIQIIRDNFCIS